jgi:hypothetical protein
MTHRTYEVTCDNCHSPLGIVRREITEKADRAGDDIIRVEFHVERCSCEDGNIRAEAKRRKRS